MKIRCTKDRLIEGVTIAERISGKNLAVLVLNSILIETDKKQLVLKATNLELGVEITIPADVEDRGTLAVPGGVLHGVLGSVIGDSPVVLSETNGNLLVNAGGGVATLKGQSAEDFPVIPQLSDAQVFKISSEDFARGVRGVIYSASTSSIKPEQASVYIYRDNKDICFAATDSFRLSEKKIAASAGVPEFEPLLIPARNLAEILRILEARDGEVEVRLGNSQIAFQVDGIYLTSRLVDGVFPDYRQVIPKNSVTEAVVLKQDLIQVFKKLSVFADKSNQVSFHLDPTKKSVLLEARNADVGETRDTILGQVTGDVLDINFNYRYVADCFQSIPTDSVTLSFGGIGRPLVIRGASDPSFLYLVMPMNK